MELVIGLLLVASLVAIIVGRLRMPYTVGLVLVGLGIAYTIFEFFTEFGFVRDLRTLLPPDLILGLLVPPLIFEAAFHIKFSDLRRNLRAILTFAIPGVILTMLMVGGLVTWGTNLFPSGSLLTIETALVFGALIAATDPVAVVALFRTLGVPKQLTILLEGESLFNDGTAIVIFNLMLGIALGVEEFHTSEVLIEFGREAGGGLVVGAMVAWLISMVIRMVNNHLIEVTLTTIAAYGSYLIADELHVSGVLAVVIAGLVIGNIGERGMSPTTRISLFNFWEFASFLANSFAFLLIGLVIDLPSLVASWPAILMAIVAVLIARAVVIYLFSYRFSNISLRMQHILYWGGLRGAISLALALSLPSELGGETQLLLRDMTFGVVLFTLLVQGTTMRPIVKRLQLATRTPAEEAYERQQARAVAAQASYQRIKSMHEEGLISEHAWQILEPPMRRQIEVRTEAVHEIMHADRGVEVAELNNAAREGLRAQRSTYNTLFTSGVISEETFARLVTEVDAALVNEEASFGDLLLRRTKDQLPITKLVCAIIGEADLQDTLTMMNVMGIPTTRLSSTTGPDGIPLITLLMGIEDGQEQEVVEAILRCCSQEPSFRRTIFDILPGTPGEELKVADMNVFIFDVEHYEEI